MSRRSLSLFSILLLFTGFSSFSLHAAANSSIFTAHHGVSEYPKLSKVSPLQAMRVASEFAKGDIHSVALLSERGILTYEVDIVSPKSGLHEVGIDAGTGRFLYNKLRNPN